MASIAFLVVFFGLALLMVLALMLVVYRAIRRRVSASSSADELGWATADDGPVRDAMIALLPGRKVWVTETRQKNDMQISRLRWQHRRGVQSTRLGGVRTLLRVPIPGPSPSVTIQARTGGALENLALGAIGHQNAPPLPPAWRWALVDGPATPLEWFTETRATALQDLLQPGERIHLRGSTLTLSTDGPPTAERIDAAAGRAHALREICR